MYDKYPEYDVPEQTIFHKFFAQRWSTILIEVLLMVVMSVAAGRALDPFGGQDETPVDDQVISETVVEVVENTPQDGISVSYIKEQGIEHILNQEYPEAEGLYDLVVMAEPDNANNYAWRGYANIHSGDYVEAETDYSTVLNIDPNSYDGHNSLCWTYGELEQFDTALNHCDKAIELSASVIDYITAYENRCWVKVEMGDYSSAYRDCMKVFEIQPNCTFDSCALAHYNIGRILIARGETSTAIEHFNRAYQYGSQYPEMYLDIASVYDQSGYTDAAVAGYKAYIQLAGENANPVAQSRLQELGVSD